MEVVFRNGDRKRVLVMDRVEACLPPLKQLGNNLFDVKGPGFWEIVCREEVFYFFERERDYESDGRRCLNIRTYGTPWGQSSSPQVRHTTREGFSCTCMCSLVTITFIEIKITQKEGIRKCQNNPESTRNI